MLLIDVEMVLFPSAIDQVSDTRSTPMMMMTEEKACGKRCVGRLAKELTK